MSLKWSANAERDLVRLHAFLVSVNPRAAAQVVQQLVRGTEQLLIHPRLGARIDEFAPRDVRRLLVGDYELRYELTDTITYILRVWHVRENR
jgi:plasmid stabilization system protein ParE